LNEIELESIQDDIAEEYGVDMEDVSVEVIYQTTGTIQTDIVDDADIDELEE